MERISKEYDTTYCKHCHQILVISAKEVHQSYCYLNHQPCNQCCNSSSICKYCHQLMPPCQSKHHRYNCKINRKSQNKQITTIRQNRKRLNIFQTVCPYCRKQSSVNQILKHLDQCKVRKDNRVLSDNIQKIGTTVRSKDIKNQIQPINHNKQAQQQQFLSPRLHRKLGIKRNNIKKDQKYPKTQQYIPMQIDQNVHINNLDTKNNKQIKQSNNFNDKYCCQLRLSTPIPLFLVPSKQKNIFEHIQTIKAHKYSIQKLIENKQKKQLRQYMNVQK